MKTVKFGLNERNHLTGTDLYVRAFQISSLVPLIYILAASNYMKLLTERGFLSSLFDLGISLLPRWEALALSGLYRSSKSELTVYFAIIIGALLYGVLMGKLLANADTSRLTRKVLVILIAVDLVMRLLPVRFNTLFGTPFAIASFIFRAACLVLIVLDLRAGTIGKAQES